MKRTYGTGEQSLLDWNNQAINTSAIRYHPITLIGYCYMCQQAHDSDEVERRVEPGETHCKKCKQPLPEDQSIAGHVVYICKRTGAELFHDHLFIPPIKTEEPIIEEPEQPPAPLPGPYPRVVFRDGKAV